jgi:hypothetical protein
MKYYSNTYVNSLDFFYNEYNTKCTIVRSHILQDLETELKIVFEKLEEIIVI